MKTLLYFAVSLVLAIVLCLFLMTTGILKVNRESLWANIETVKNSAFSVLTRTENVIRNKNISANQSRKVPLKTSASPPTDDRILSSKPGPYTDRNRLHERALEFLSGKQGHVDPDVEEQFTEFLLQELALNQEDAEKFVRMCFWKNFVTLQEQWQSTDGDRMGEAFRREKELKKAGFAAKGLRLMPTEIQHAEARLEELQGSSSHRKIQGDKS